jgi:hypothetical protein
MRPEHNICDLVKNRSSGQLKHPATLTSLLTEGAILVLTVVDLLVEKKVKIITIFLHMPHPDAS